MIRHTTKRPKLVQWYMDFYGYHGFSSMWGTIYYKTEEDMNNERLRKHELQHAAQMKRDGKLWYFLKYNLYWLKYGYKNNPYEIEARKAELS